MPECLFCKIARGEIPSNKVYEDASFLGFRDIDPQAPVHIVVIPKKHIATMNDATKAETQILGDLLLVCQHIAKDENVAEPGYRIVINCNRNAGQSVFHIHAHVLGGRHMNWPPG
jgi:histidine triad (HIT) family protein